MYTDERINEIFKDKYNTIDSQCKEYLDAYINIGRTPSFLNSVLGGSLSLGFKYKM